MKQYYSNLFYPESIIYHGAGEFTEEFKAFVEDYLRVMTDLKDLKDPVIPSDPKYNTRSVNIRKWEVWVVLSNARIEPHHSLLEYGAWPSFYCVYVSRLVKEVFAIDNLQGFGRNDGFAIASLNKMFPDVWISEINKYNRPNLQVSQGDIQLTNFPNKKFDRIVSYGVHEHIKDDLQGLREIHRILKDDGIVSMTVDFFHHGWPYCEAFQGRCYDPETLTALVEGAGFTYIDTPEWFRYDGYKDRVNTINHPDVCAIAIALRKK